MRRGVAVCALSLVVAAGAEAGQPPPGPRPIRLDAEMLKDLEVLRELDLAKNLDLLRVMDMLRNLEKTAGSPDKKAEPKR